MSRWVLEGLRTLKPTTRYPGERETAAGVSPGLPEPPEPDAAKPAEGVASRCPTGALEGASDVVEFENAKCVHCFRCQRGEAPLVSWSPGFEWARPLPEVTAGSASLHACFGRSLHIRVVDAGACGACLREMALLGGPHYNMHRLGFFVTPTPRQADVLLVAGPVTDHMREPLQDAFESMPGPKRVVAVGACAASGGVFGPSFASGDGAADIVPVDVVLPGCPPPPLAILHALLLVTGRAEPADPRRTPGERSE